MARLRWFVPPVIVASVGAGVALVAACSDDVSHLYTAQIYNSGSDCIGDTTSLDLVDGDEPDTDCPPVCLVGSVSTYDLPSDDASGGVTATTGAKEVFISTMCAPFPVAFDTSDGDADCKRAKAAFARGAKCLPDGGSSNPLGDAAPPPPDAAPASCAGNVGEYTLASEMAAEGVCFKREACTVCVQTVDPAGTPVYWEAIFATCTCAAPAVASAPSDASTDAPADAPLDAPSDALPDAAGDGADDAPSDH